MLKRRLVCFNVTNPPGSRTMSYSRNKKAYNEYYLEPDIVFQGVLTVQYVIYLITWFSLVALNYYCVHYDNVVELFFICTSDSRFCDICFLCWVRQIFTVIILTMCNEYHEHGCFIWNQTYCPPSICNIQYALKCNPTLPSNRSNGIGVICI